MELQFYCQNPRCRRALDVDETLFEMDFNVLQQEKLSELEERLKEYEYILAINESVNGSVTEEENVKLKSTSNNVLPFTSQPVGDVSKSLAQSAKNLLHLSSPAASSFQLSSSLPSSPAPSHKPTSKMLFLSKLFEVSSDVTSTDMPLCKECTHKHLKILETQVAEAIKENTSYKNYMRKLEAEKENFTQGDQLEAEIQQLINEENELKEQLKKVEDERKLLRVEMSHLESEAKRIKEIEERYWVSYNGFQNELQIFQNEHESVKMKLNHSKQQLEKLKITDIYNDTFHIWHEGHFGTINNFRLGRLTSQPVDWNEINAGWGQATQLLHTIAKKLNFKFSTFRLLPMGSCSKMERLSDKSTYELFGSSDISLGRLFWYRRFDNGMVAFLQCLKEIADLAESKDKNFRLPYRIEKDRIGDMTIKIQFNNEETWTKSLKYMLTDLKFLLVWVAKLP